MTRDDIFFILHERNYITDVARNPVPVPPGLDATQPGTTPAIVTAVDAQAASANSMALTTTARTGDLVGGSGAEGSSSASIAPAQSAESRASLHGAIASSAQDGEPQRSSSLIGSPAALEGSNGLGLHESAPLPSADLNGPSPSVAAAPLPLPPPASGPATPSTPGPATTTAFGPGVHPPQSVPPQPHHQSQSQPSGVFRGNQWTKLREQKLVQAAIAAGQPAPEGLIHKWVEGGGGVVTESGGGGVSEVSTPQQQPPPPSRPASAPPRAAGHYRGNGWTVRKKDRDPHGSSGTPTSQQRAGAAAATSSAAAGGRTHSSSPVRKLVIPTSYKIHPDRAEVRAYLEKHFETKKDWIRLRPDRLKWTPFLVTRVFGLGVDVGSTAVDGMAHQGGDGGGDAAEGPRATTSSDPGQGQGGLGAKGGESLSTSVFGGAAAEDAARGTDFALDNYAAGGGGYHASGAVDDADDVDAEGEVDDEVVGARRPTRGRKVAAQSDSEEEEEEPLFPPSSSSTDDDDDSDDEDGYFPRKRPRYGGAGPRSHDRGGSRRRAAGTTNGTSNSPQQQRRTSSRRLSSRLQCSNSADRVDGSAGNQDGNEADPTYGDGVGPSRRLPGRQASRAASRILATQAGMLRDSSSSEEEDAERRRQRRAGRSGTSPVKMPPAVEGQQPEQLQELESAAMSDRANRRFGDEQATSMEVDPSPELVAG